MKLRRILIVTEGKQTEPNYFKGFPANQEVYDSLDVKGVGYNTVSLVQKAIDLKDEAERNGQPYIEVWAVFDRDEFPLSNFAAAIELAMQNGIHPAYSIESFELWYLLHFSYCESALSRDDYCRKLTALLGKTYEKNDPNMFRMLQKDKRQP